MRGGNFLCLSICTSGTVPQSDQGKAKGYVGIVDRGDPLRAEPLGPGTERGLYFLSKP